MIGIDNRGNTGDAVEVELLESGAALGDRVDLGQIGPELGHGAASGQPRRRVGIAQDRLEDDVQPQAGRHLPGEDDPVLAAVRPVGRRGIEAIDQCDRDVLAGRERRCRQLPLGRRTAPRESVEREIAVGQEVVAMGSSRIGQPRPRILGIEPLPVKLRRREAVHAAARDDLVEESLKSEPFQQRHIRHHHRPPRIKRRNRLRRRHRRIHSMMPPRRSEREERSKREDDGRDEALAHGGSLLFPCPTAASGHWIVTRTREPEL